jgi:hypothetical protein
MVELNQLADLFADSAVRKTLRKIVQKLQQAGAQKFRIVGA